MDTVENIKSYRPRQILRVITLVLIIQLKFCEPVFGRIVDKDVSISVYNVPSLILAMGRSFSFGSDSSLFFQLTCPTKVSKWNNDMLIGMCHQLGEVEPNTLDGLPCLHMKVQQAADDPGSFYLNHTFSRQRNFLIMTLICPPVKPKLSGVLVTPTTICRSRLTTMNKNSHLSMDEIPEPIIYKILVMIWVILMVCWIINWTIFNEYSNSLHKFMFVAPTFKLTNLVIEMIYWRYMDSTGIERRPIVVCLYLISSIEDLLLFISIMMAAEGWCVMRPYIKQCRSALIPITFFFYVASELCVVYANTYFLAFAISCIIFTIYRALKWSSESIEILQRQITITRHLVSIKEIYFEGNSPEAPLLKKLRIYTRLRQLVALYTITYAVIITIGSFLSQYTWVRTIIFEIPEVLVYIALGFIFYLRDFSRYETASLELFQDNTVVMLLPSPNHKWPQKQTLMLGHAINMPRANTDLNTQKDILPAPSPV
ncbi:uncharacterized protein [Antedon mediterranea]|uniref:uncharacterized protein isoform X2 n=1 Tax=Antedon mediterranea TaxID=105859 RepID=UPI003AF61C87